MTSSFAVFEAAMWVKSMIENQKKIKYGNQEMLHKSPSKGSFRNGIHSLLNRADPRESADIIYLLCDAYRLFEGLA